MLSRTMNTDVLHFGGLVGFWVSLSLSLWGGRFSLFITSFIHCIMTFIISFTLFFCSANFVNWLSLSDCMRFEVMHIQVLRRSSFFSEILSSFQLSYGLLLLLLQELRLSNVLMALFFSFTSTLKKPVSLLSEVIWLWRLRRSWCRWPFSFVPSGSCCFTSHRIVCFNYIFPGSS